MDARKWFFPSRATTSTGRPTMSTPNPWPCRKAHASLLRPTTTIRRTTKPIRIRMLRCDGVIRRGRKCSTPGSLTQSIEFRAEFTDPEFLLVQDSSVDDEDDRLDGPLSGGCRLTDDDVSTGRHVDI